MNCSKLMGQDYSGGGDDANFSTTVTNLIGTKASLSGAIFTGIVTAPSFVKASNSGGFLKADGTEDTNTYLTSFTETNDLSSAVTWTNVPNANITESSVTQHQAALSITESQISDLQSYLTSYTETQTLNDVVGLGSATTQTITVGTATTGVVVRPDGMNISGVSTFQSDVHLGDNDKLIFGDDDDLEIFHNSSNGNTIIQETTGGNLVIKGSNLFLQSSSNENSKFFKGEADGAVTLYYDDVAKLETTGYGVTITGGLNVSGVATAHKFTVGDADAPAGDKIVVGLGSDLEIYHYNAGSSYIDHNNSSNSLFIRGQYSGD